MCTNRNLILEKKWFQLLNKIEMLVDKKPQDLNSVLYLVGIQELGQGVKRFTKEEKQDLLHIATCKVMSYGGYYKLTGHDDAGWPHWAIQKPMPKLSLEEQELIIKSFVIEYFEKEIL